MKKDNESPKKNNMISQEQFLEVLDNHFAQAGKRLELPQYVISDERRLVYIVNSKVACSSIKASFLDEDTPDDYSVHRMLIDKEMYKAYLTEEQTHYFFFSFVRNPFSRLVSCYESKYHIDPEKHGIREFDKFLFGFLSEDEGFDAFVRKVCNMPSRLMNRHFMPQYDILYNSKGLCHCDYIGHFENLDEEFESIRERFNLRRLPHLNRSKDVDWRDYYTPETKSLVREKYKKDFEVFGYTDR